MAKAKYEYATLECRRSLMSHKNIHPLDIEFDNRYNPSGGKHIFTSEKGGVETQEFSVLPNIVETLNKLSEYRWELITVEKDIYYFKRELL